MTGPPGGPQEGESIGRNRGYAFLSGLARADLDAMFLEVDRSPTIPGSHVRDLARAHSEEEGEGEVGGPFAVAVFLGCLHERLALGGRENFRMVGRYTYRFQVGNWVVADDGPAVDLVAGEPLEEPGEDKVPLALGFGRLARIDPAEAVLFGDPRDREKFLVPAEGGEQVVERLDGPRTQPLAFLGCHEAVDRLAELQLGKGALADVFRYRVDKRAGLALEELDGGLRVPELGIAQGGHARPVEDLVIEEFDLHEGDMCLRLLLRLETLRMTLALPVNPDRAIACVFTSVLLFGLLVNLSFHVMER